MVMTIKNTLLTCNMYTLFIGMILGNASERVIFPLLTLVFFDPHSGLLAPETTHAWRSHWYAVGMALPSIATFIAAPLLSCLSDYYGRKPLLLLCLCGTAGAGFILAAAILNASLYVFIFGLFLQGLFCRTNPIAQAVIGETTTGSNKLLMMGYLQSMIALGAFLGPILGGYLAYLYFKRLNFSAGFFMCGILSVLAIVIYGLFFKETGSIQKNALSWRLPFGSIAVLKERATLTLVGILGCGQFAWSLYYQYAPVTLRLVMHVSASCLGIFVACMALWVVLGSSFGIYFLRRRYPLFTCLRVGLSLLCLGTLLLILGCYLHNSWLIWCSSLPAASGDVIAFGVLSTLYLNRYPRQPGQAMGACYFNAALIWTITGLGGGYLMAQYTLLPLLIAPLAPMAALLLTAKSNTRALFD